MLTFTEKFALVAVAGVVAGVVVWVQWYFPRPTFTPKCTTDILEVQKALDQASRELQGANGADNLSKCAIYGKRSFFPTLLRTG